MKTQSKKNIIFSWFLQKNHYNNQCYDEVMIYFINTHHNETMELQMIYH